MDCINFEVEKYLQNIILYPCEYKFVKKGRTKKIKDIIDYLTSCSKGIQLHAETRSKQIAAWRTLVLEYHRSTKQSVLDIREVQRSPLFNNTSINNLGQLSQEGIQLILDDLAKTKNAEPLDRMKNRWYIYWHTLEEWGDMVYNWAQNNGMINTVCTLFELTQGDNTCDEEFHGLDTEVLIKALRTLEDEKKAEVIIFDETQGVKFF